jgi:hypothetical protein
MTQTPHGVVPVLQSTVLWQSTSLQLNATARSSVEVTSSAREAATVGAAGVGATDAAWLFRTATEVSNAPNINVNTNDLFDMKHDSLV